MAVVGGPTIGPIVGGAICQTISWRWTQYVSEQRQGLRFVYLHSLGHGNLHDGGAIP